MFRAAENALLESRIEPAEDDGGDVVQVDLGHAREGGVVTSQVGVQEVMQLRGEFDTRRPTTYTDKTCEQLLRENSESTHQQYKS